MKQLFIFLQYILPHHFLSRIIGRLAECRLIWLKNLLIRNFIRIYNVNMSEAAISEASDFGCFNDFFTRELAPNVRPFCTDSDSLVSPVDGAVSEFGQITANKIIQAKGKNYSLVDLLGGSEKLASNFIDGAFITLYLSPKDYHRIHCPVAGTLVESTYIPGSLFSVNETSVNGIPNIFARNERLVTSFETERGSMALIMVGALIVAGIKSVWNPDMYQPNVKTRDSLAPPPVFAAGDELGQFRLGSTVILLFQPNTIIWDSSVSNQHPVRLGQKLARFSTMSN